MACGMGREERVAGEDIPPLHYQRCARVALCPCDGTRRMAMSRNQHVSSVVSSRMNLDCRLFCE